MPAGAISEIFSDVVHESERKRPEPIDLAPIAGPHIRQRLRLAEAAFVSLCGCIIMRMHCDRLWHIQNPVTLGATPAGPFVFLGIGDRFCKMPPRPDVLANSAVGHAEEMVPLGRLAALAKAPFVIMRIHSSAVRPRNLPPEHCGGLRIQQSVQQRPQPVGSLWCRIRVEKYNVFRLRQTHTAILHSSWNVVARFNL